MNQDLIAYYRDRANEYDKVYENREEQDDLLQATTIFQSLFAGKDVLEIACGTGYWTARIAQTAASVQATDINQSMVNIAKTKQTNERVSFAVADMYRLTPDRKYDGVFGGFVWSHILLQDLPPLMDSIREWLHPGGILAFIDSNSVEGTPHDRRKTTETDEQGNQYQTRRLENGTSHRVLKNFPTQDFMAQTLSRIHATDIQFVHLKHYWIGTCRLPE
jgi:ubiquinone/menaquinone biosynthesis C-methylase UbiE